MKPFFNKNAISPLIATILLVIVAVAIIGIIISWGKGFTNDSLSNTTNIANLKVNDATHFVFEPKINGSLLTFRYSPPQNLKNETITITGYSVPGSLEVVSLIEPIILVDGYNGIERLNLSDFDINLNNTDLILITDNNGYINLNKINLTNYVNPIPSCNGFPYILYEDSKICIYHLNSGSNQWGCQGQYLNPPATSNTDGLQNTEYIISYHNNIANFNNSNYYDYIGNYEDLGCHINNNGTVAAKICDDLSYAGFDDWYLPSIYQLQAIWNVGDGTVENMNLNINKGDYESSWQNFIGNNYWSSTEYISSYAYRYQMYAGGLMAYINKSSNLVVRCVRDPI